jgi:hypothetical protein
MRRALLAAVLAGATVALVPLAHATPPDQTWQSGVYDDADFDDVVLLVTSGISGAFLAAWALLFVRLLVVRLPPEPLAVLAISLGHFASSRAPPSADATV